MFLVTLVHDLPPSRVSCTWPSFVPAQISPFSFGDSVIAITTGKYSTPMLSGVRPPEICCLLLSFVVKSGLIVFQVMPPSLLMWTNWLPAYRVLRSYRETTNGMVQLKRYFTSPAGHPSGLSGHISTLRDMPALTSYRATMPPTLPAPDAVDQTMLLSKGSGVANPLSPPPTVCHIERGMPKLNPNRLGSLLLLEIGRA